LVDALKYPEFYSTCLMECAGGLSGPRVPGKTSYLASRMDTFKEGNRFHVRQMTKQVSLCNVSRLKELQQQFIGKTLA
jgi:hypothetical protein